MDDTSLVKENEDIFSWMRRESSIPSSVSSIRKPFITAHPTSVNLCLWDHHRELRLHISFCNLQEIYNTLSCTHLYSFLSLPSKNAKLKIIEKTWKSYNPWRKMKTTRRKRSLISFKTPRDKWCVFWLGQFSVIFLFSSEEKLTSYIKEKTYCRNW